MAVGVGSVVVAGLAASAAAGGCPAGEAAADALRATHEAARRAHLEGNAELMAPAMAERMVMASRGELSVSPKAAALAFFRSYFERVKYLEWSDSELPIVSVAPDGRSGWMAVKVRARYVERAKPDAAPKAFRSSWIATYERVGCDWKMTGNASAVVEE
ncbi:MAG TPA: nuclear transport factor 2 family protein [Allosphingosinicella sp.]|jgi:hypothetical protein